MLAEMFSPIYAVFIGCSSTLQLHFLQLTVSVCARYHFFVTPKPSYGWLQVCLPSADHGRVANGWGSPVPPPPHALPPITTVPALPYTARYVPSSHGSVITPDCVSLRCVVMAGSETHRGIMQR